MVESRRPLVVANWKMNKTVGESINFVREFTSSLSQPGSAVEVVLAPPFTALAKVSEALVDTSVGVAAQNCFWETAGAYTGEVSVSMLQELNCQYVLVGHSERRQFFGDTDQTVNRRALAALQGGIRPIVCIGESLAERDAGRTFEVVSRQLAGSLAGLTREFVNDIVIAYEPVWAIGTGRNATADQAQHAHAFIRERLTEQFGHPAAHRIRIQYGGSVKPDNAAELLSQPDVDGALVGGASLKVNDFLAIVQHALP